MRRAHSNSGPMGWGEKLEEKEHVVLFVHDSILFFSSFAIYPSYLYMMFE